MEPLLLLNDQVDVVVAKAELLASEASIGIGIGMGMGMGSSGRDSSRSDSEASSSAPDALKCRQVVMECMYALRRGGDRLGRPCSPAPLVVGRQLPHVCLSVCLSVCLGSQRWKW